MRSAIEVRIGGRVVEVCCEECAQKLGETSAVPREGMKRGLRSGPERKEPAIEAEAFFEKRRSIVTPSGRISYVEQGSGPVALFVHGVLLNGYLWRHQLADVVRRASLHRRRPARRTGTPRRTEIRTYPSRRNAHMLRQFLDALKIDAGRSRRQRQRRRHLPDLRRAASGSRPQPDADELRHARQLAARGLQAVRRRWWPRAGCRYA